jgi:predicted AlkP superfamily phosphohydrolase/phosphomutase
VSAPKVLYVALDACDREIVKTLADAGELPTFRTLFDHAAIAEVEPPPGVYISANWPSFSSALTPDHHDYVCWVEVDPETYEWVETIPERAGGRPFWHALGEAGHDVAIFDVPHALADPNSPVTQVLEWGCHDRHRGSVSVPGELIHEIETEVGRHPIGQIAEQRPDNFAPCDFVQRDGLHRTPAESLAFWEQLLMAADRKEAASLRLLDQRAWSLYAVVIGESHCVGHQMWAVHDADHPRHDPSTVALIGDPVREMYRRLDGVVASHLGRADADTTVYVQLSHGMGPHYDGTHLLDIVLQRLHEADDVRRGWRSTALEGVLGRVPPQWQTRAMSVMAPRMRDHADRLPPGPNAPWTLPLRDRQWFQVPANSTGAIRLNVRGREGNGQIDPGDVDRVCAELTRWFEEIINVDSGEPLVHRIYRSDDVYERRPDDRLPDLFVEWNSNAPIERVYSPRIGMVAAVDQQWRTGDHRRHGLLFARGPGIAPGLRADRVPMTDVGPTLCAALGVTLDGVDGRPLVDLVPTTSPGEPSATERTARLRELEPDQPSLRRSVTRLAAEHRSTRALASHVDVRATQMDGRVNHLAADVTALDLRVALLERQASVRTVTDWVANAVVEESLLVSIVMPTRNRADKIPSAIESVLAQAYKRWELVVVDDGSVDETQAVLAKFDDPRIVVVSADLGNAGAARNVALRAAAGDVVAYLDDDNLMLPWWCKAIVWGFTQRPHCDVLYGALVIDDIARARHEGEGAMPAIHFEPYDFDVLTQHNFTDMNVLAHRAGLPEAHFDESVHTYSDWDLFWRLTRSKPPLELPVLACHYTTDGDDRLSLDPDDLVYRDALRAKFARLLAEG